MGRSAKKTMTRNRTAPASKVLESLTGSDALSILKILAARDDKLEEVIDAIARELFGQVDAENVATDVQMELELLEVEEVWDRSGAKRDGYVDPGDAAWQMFEDALKPFQDAIEKYTRLSMSTQARSYCEGVLKGIYDFHQDSSTEYKDWAVDAPSGFFGQVLDEWKSLFNGRPPLLEMEKFLHAHCPDWTEWGMRQLRKRKRKR
jgi:hypothetical protein